MLIKCEPLQSPLLLYGLESAQRSVKGKDSMHAGAVSSAAIFEAGYLPKPLLNDSTMSLINAETEIRNY